MRESQGKTSPKENENPEISTQRCEIDVLCAITDYIFAKSKILFRQDQIKREKKKWEGSSGNIYILVKSETILQERNYF